MLNSKKKSKGFAIPVLISLTVFFGVVFWASAGMITDTNANQISPITNPNINTSASIFADNKTIVNTDCGGDVFCNLSNVYNLMSVSSSYVLLTILIITPAIVALGWIVIAWIRGV